MNNIWKKISAIACAGLLCTSTLAFSGCGDSAYELAVKNGTFVGTEEEWLRSLKGENGKDAEDIDIQDVYQAALEEGLVENWDEFLEKYLTLTLNENNDTETIANCTSSVVSVYCGFSKTVGNVWTATAVNASAGSGVIVDLNKEAGNAYIITNYHVLYDSGYQKENNGISEHIFVYPYGARNHFTIHDSYTVRDGKIYKEPDGYLDDGYTENDIGDQGGDGIRATYVGGAMDYDIAILQIQGSEYLTKSAATEATIGDSNEVTLGEKAYAIGNANALGISTTSGIISVESEYINMSALDGRDEDGDGDVDSVRHRVVRTDALINHGNSGGALFNANGELIGITNAKNVEPETEGIGYALPITQVKYVMQNILDYGDGALHRAILGVTTYINESVASMENGKLKITESIIVSEAPTQGYSAYGKLFYGDIIKSITIDGVTTEVTRNYQITDLLLNVRLGDTIALKVVGGDGTERTETIKFDKTSYFVTYA